MSKIKKEKFPFLSDPFENWFDKQVDRVIDQSIDANETLLDRLKMSQEEFHSVFLEPLKGLDSQTIKAITKIQTNYLKEYTLIPDGSEIVFVKNYLFDALSWLLVNIEELQLFELSVTYQYYQEPYLQCLYCGRPDEDPRGKAFNKSRKYCHSFDCHNVDSNPKEHPDCCFGKWAFSKKALIQKINNAIEKKDEQKAIKIFIDFCNNMLDYHLENDKYSIQTDEDHPALVIEKTDFSYLKI